MGLKETLKLWAENLEYTAKSRIEGTPFDQMMLDIVKREGGYVNDPDDAGGPTKYGITQATLEKWRAEPVTADDVKMLTKREAVEIYKKKYFINPKFYLLPDWLEEVVTDTGVLHGPRKAIVLLQRLLNILLADVGESTTLIKVDGRLGPITMQTLYHLITYHHYDYDEIVNGYIELRLDEYDKIVAARPSQRKFLRGWRNRAMSFYAG